jgi:choline kinase
MNIGIIPVGGKGERMGMPFAKELLPLAGYSVYTPVISHTVNKMLAAGVQKIIFVHGHMLKQALVDLYPEHIHICQKVLGFSKALYTCLALSYEMDKKAQIVFGLPDSVYTGNPFNKLLNTPGVVCALFNGADHLKVDRLSLDNSQIFEVKSSKTTNNSVLFWGAFKLPFEDFKQAANMSVEIPEIGNILNSFHKSYVNMNDYYDLGTWESYNNYVGNTCLPLE